MKNVIDWLFDNFIIEELKEFSLKSDDTGIGVVVKWYDTHDKEYVKVIDIDGVSELTMKQIRIELITLLKFIRERIEENIGEDAE